MDPNANLKEQRRIVKRLQDDTLNADDRLHYAERLADLVEALDNWLSNGGFPPTDWGRRSVVGDWVQP